MKVGEVWIVRVLWDHSPPTPVRIMEVLPHYLYDVNYELDESKPGDMRILPGKCFIEQVTTK